MTETLIFLHGWGGTKNSLAPLSNEFEKDGFNTLILEMPGHGETAQMNKPWSMEDFSKWAKEEIEMKVTDTNNIVLIGHSFGGKIILDLLTSKLLSPKAVVLIDSNGIKPRNSIKKYFYKSLSVIYKPFQNFLIFQNLRKLVYKYFIRENDYLNTKAMVKESFKLFNEQHYNDKLDKISTNTLIIWGSKDKVTPLWMAKLLKLKIKNSKLKILEDTHGLPLKQPRAVYTLIKEFLENNG